MVFIFLINYFIIYELATTITFTSLSLFDFNGVLILINFLDVSDACLTRAFFLIRYNFILTLRLLLYCKLIKSTC